MTNVPSELGMRHYIQHPKIIVVAEEDDDLREILASYLESQGAHVLALREPPGRDELLRLRPDVLLLDLIYGGEPRGLTLLHHDYRGLDAAIVVLTAASELVSEQRDDLEQLTTRVLLKPFELDEFDVAMGLMPEWSSPYASTISIIGLGPTPNAGY